MHRAPALEGQRQRRQILADQHDIGDAARRVGRRCRQGDADIGDLQCRGVVDAVADHRDARPRALQAGDDLQLLRRGQPGEDMLVARCLYRNLIEPVTLDHLGMAVGQADFGGDCQRGGALVAGQHHRGDARPPKRLHQLNGAGADRVGHADETEPDQVCSWGSDILTGQDEAVGDAEHPQPGFRHRQIVGLDSGAGDIVERAGFALFAAPSTERQHRVRVALDRDQPVVLRHRMHGDHVAAALGPLHRREPRMPVSQRVDIGAELAGGFEQGHLG